MGCTRSQPFPTIQHLIQHFGRTGILLTPVVVILKLIARVQAGVSHRQVMDAGVGNRIDQKIGVTSICLSGAESERRGQGADGLRDDLVQIVVRRRIDL